MSTDISAMPSVSTELKLSTLAVRMKQGKMGVGKTLSASQKARAADVFNAKAKRLSASKKLVDTKHPKYRAVTAVLTNAKAYWESVTVPFPENGIRLIRQDRVEAFQEQVIFYQGELNQAVAELDAVHGSSLLLFSIFILCSESLMLSIM